MHLKSSLGSKCDLNNINSAFDYQAIDFETYVRAEQDLM